MPAGYSKRSLVEKLGIKEGFRLALFNAPEDYPRKLADLPSDVRVTTDLERPLDFIHLFTKSQRELAKEFPRLKAALSPNGMLWISWPKGSAKIATDLNENAVREIGLQNGLVDVKVAAIDEVWSGLKFVYRVADRG